MGLADRLAAGTTAAVLATSLGVGGASVLWVELRYGEWPTELIAVEVLLTVLAVGASHLALRGAAIPSMRLLGDLAQEIRSRASAEEPTELTLPDDEEVGAVTRAVNHLLRAERAQLEEIRRALKDRSLVLERSGQGILVVDGIEGKIRYANPFFRQILNLRGQPEGRVPIEVVPLAEVQDAVDRLGQGESSVELNAATGQRDLVVRAVRLETDDLLVTVDDVTDFRDAERSRSDFVANVSHELRTPVSAIMGYAETLLEYRDRLSPDTVPLVETIDRNARRLRDLFEDLLRLHRIEARKRALPLQDTLLRPLLTEATASAADAAARRGQRFELDCDDTLSAIVNTEALATIVTNLAINATNYTQEGGRIVVRARRVRDEVVIDVTDDGLGIAPAHHERIFERFFRVDEARSRRVGGTGLGLAIVKHLALATGLRVALTSALGAGSTFSVHIPAGPRKT